MKKQFFRAFIMFGLLITVSAGSALAQAPEKVVVDIPFNFVAGDKALPAGEYTVKNVSTGRAQAMLIRSADGRSASIVLTNAVESGSVQKRAKLLFTQYGNRYFLSQIWGPGAGVGRAIPKSRLQREAEKGEVRATNAEPPTVTLAGRPQ
ncbi:MAG TPA: hypothetical protein VKC34_08180 [Blastocatellia bacterium]|nr:hypothetical protein [Blastocatellia bacterium]